MYSVNIYIGAHFFYDPHATVGGRTAVIVKQIGKRRLAEESWLEQSLTHRNAELGFW